MDIFGKEAIVEIPAQITPEQKAWLDMMVRKGKIAVPPGGTLPEGSVISIFMRTLLWNSEEQGQTLDMVTREGLEELRSQRNLVELKVQLAQDQKTWLEKMAASSKVVPAAGDSVVSMFIRVLLTNAMDQQKALEASDPWADDDEM
ncbi:MAG: hypothetical protein E6K60_08835 [Nitrospirae bacterium]|nr:MAG: hypothetical protein E6K60_08835 [Nitrospirota bacterium]